MQSCLPGVSGERVTGVWWSCFLFVQALSYFSYQSLLDGTLFSLSDGVAKTGPNSHFGCLYYRSLGCVWAVTEVSELEKTRAVVESMLSVDMLPLRDVQNVISPWQVKGSSRFHFVIARWERKVKGGWVKDTLFGKSRAFYELSCRSPTVK